MLVTNSFSFLLNPNRYTALVLLIKAAKMTYTSLKPSDGIVNNNNSGTTKDKPTTGVFLSIVSFKK